MPPCRLFSQRSCCRTSVALAMLAGIVISADGQTADFGVKLQPFLNKKASTIRAPLALPAVVRPELMSEPMNVAYYRPAPPVAAPARVDADEETDEISDYPFVRRTFVSSGPTVEGNYAVLRRGVAYAPSRAPGNVKQAIWAVNSLRRKPYVWGGGHRSFDDRGYDCSGTVSYALHHAGLLDSPMPSSDFMRYGERGRGRWITVYARNGHTFAVIAGLRLDTTDMRDGGDVGPRWFVGGRDVRNFEARHPAGW